MSARHFIIGLAAGIAALAVGAPLAGAGNSIVDDYWRDGVAATSPTSNTVVDDYWRDQPALASRTSNTIVDDYFRDAPAVVSSGSGGFDWADFGIGIAVALGAMLLLAGLGAGVLAVRTGRSERTRPAGGV